MKRLILLLAIIAASATGARAQGWAVGGRMGSGLQVVGQKYLTGGNYLEGRLGMGWNHGFSTSELSVLHMWHVNEMGWTRSGVWSFDAGLGAMFGGANNYFTCGVQGVARLAYELADVPVTFGIDWSPSFGPKVYSVYPTGGDVRVTQSAFSGRGLANLGVTCIYRF